MSENVSDLYLIDLQWFASAEDEGRTEKPSEHKLKKAREDKELNQVDVAVALNIPRSTLANYETGRTEPDIETIGKLITFYEIDANWLLSTTGK